jgi:hypothetical protein
MVRQERTARPATAAARQTPPGARPSRGGRCNSRGRSAAAAQGGPSRRCLGRSHEAPGNGRPRGMAATVSVRCQHRTRRDRTRLTRRLALFARPKSDSGRCAAAPIRASAVDGSADQTGIIADSGGEPSGLRLARLRSVRRRVCLICVVEILICALISQQSVPSVRAWGRLVATCWGEKRAIPVDRPFLLRIPTKSPRRSEMMSPGITR